MVAGEVSTRGRDKDERSRSQKQRAKKKKHRSKSHAGDASPVRHRGGGLLRVLSRQLMRQNGEQVRLSAAAEDNAHQNTHTLKGSGEGKGGGKQVDKLRRHTPVLNVLNSKFLHIMPLIVDPFGAKFFPVADFHFWQNFKKNDHCVTFGRWESGFYLVPSHLSWLPGVVQKCRDGWVSLRVRF